MQERSFAKQQLLLGVPFLVVRRAIGISPLRQTSATARPARTRRARRWLKTSFVDSVINFAQASNRWWVRGSSPDRQRQ